MTTVVVSVIKEGTVEVDVENARRYLAFAEALGTDEVAKMGDEEVAEVYVSYAEGNEIDIEYDRIIKALQNV